jgi:hypothetical protein
MKPRVWPRSKSWARVGRQQAADERGCRGFRRLLTEGGACRATAVGRRRDGCSRFRRGHRGGPAGGRPLGQKPTRSSWIRGPEGHPQEAAVSGSVVGQHRRGVRLRGRRQSGAARDVPQRRGAIHARAALQLARSRARHGCQSPHWPLRTGLRRQDHHCHEPRPLGGVGPPVVGHVLGPPRWLRALSSCFITRARRPSREIVRARRLGAGARPSSTSANPSSS